MFIVDRFRSPDELVGAVVVNVSETSEGSHPFIDQNHGVDGVVVDEAVRDIRLHYLVPELFLKEDLVFRVDRDEFVFGDGETVVEFDVAVTVLAVRYGTF